MTPGFRQRVSGALLLSLLLLGLCVVGAPSAPAAPPDGDPPGLVVDRGGAEPPVASRVRRWPGRTITYTESLPKKWDPSLKLALDAWNTSGGKLKFKKASGGKAQLTIGYGPTQGYAGLATIGPARNAYVHLSTGYKNVDVTLEVKLGVGRLLTHELGHVVGFGHVGRGCQLMVTYIPATCQLLSFEPGYRVCRWIDKPLLKAFIAAYGGKGKLAPKFCPIDPLPPQLASVAFTDGTTAPVRVTWTPQQAKPGERVHIWVRAGACPKDVDSFSPDLEVFVSPDAGTWTDPDVDSAGGPHCYRVQVVNKSMGGRSAFTRVLTRYQQLPAAPSVSNITYDEPNARWTFDATWPAGTTLVARRALAADGSCPGNAGLEDAYEEFFTDVANLFLYDNGHTECVLFLSEAASGARSPTISATFVLPP